MRVGAWEGACRARGRRRGAAARPPHACCPNALALWEIPRPSKFGGRLAARARGSASFDTSRGSSKSRDLRFFVSALRACVNSAIFGGGG